MTGHRGQVAGFFPLLFQILSFSPLFLDSDSTCGAEQQSTQSREGDGHVTNLDSPGWEYLGNIGRPWEGERKLGNTRGHHLLVPIWFSQPLGAGGITHANQNERGRMKRAADRERTLAWESKNTAEMPPSFNEYLSAVPNSPPPTPDLFLERSLIHLNACLC